MFAARSQRLPRKRNGRPETARDNGQRFHAEDRAPKGPVKLDKYGMVIQTISLDFVGTRRLCVECSFVIVSLGATAPTAPRVVTVDELFVPNALAS
jgi:hypothetical protein